MIKSLAKRKLFKTAQNFKNWPKPSPPVLIFPMKSCFCIKKGYAILISFYAWCALYLPRLWLAHSGNGFDRQIDALLYNVTMNDWERQHYLERGDWKSSGFLKVSLVSASFYIFLSFLPTVAGFELTTLGYHFTTTIPLRPGLSQLILRHWTIITPNQAFWKNVYFALHL